MPTAPESELLFRLVQTAGNRGGASVRIKELIRTDINWSEVFRLTSHHGLTSQLYQSLSGQKEMVPAPVWHQIRSAYQTNTTRNLQYCQQLHTICEAFQEHDIRAIPYKGPVLTEYAYKDLGSRWFGDIDFLVSDSDILAAIDILLEQGYERLNYTEIAAEKLINQDILRWGKEFRFYHEENDVVVELRFDFIGGGQEYSEIFDNVWKQTTKTLVAGQSIISLSPEDRVLLLLIHGTKHGWRRLSWVYDVALVLQQHNIDWQDVSSRAEQYGWSKAVLFGLVVITELTGVELPACVQDELELCRQYRWATLALKTVICGNQTGLLNLFEPAATVLFLNDTYIGSFIELVDVLFSPRRSDYEWLPLPVNFYLLYYLIRPVRLGGVIINKLFNIILRVF